MAPKGCLSRDTLFDVLRQDLLGGKWIDIAKGDKAVALKHAIRDCIFCQVVQSVVVLFVFEQNLHIKSADTELPMVDFLQRLERSLELPLSPVHGNPKKHVCRLIPT
jgi:hypothetical protein